MENKRQIKFRAWIPDEDEHGKMFTLPFYDGEHIDGLNENGTIEICRYNDYIVKVAGLDDENISEGFQPCETVIMQFTGLKDNNGKEVYEGDILKISKETMTNYYITDVRFLQGAFCVRTSWNDFYPMFSLARPGDELEVIGNIYENPELLTHENNRTIKSMWK